MRECDKRKIRRVREGWDEAFRLMAERGDDKLLDEGTFTKWDDEEWDFPLDESGNRPLSESGFPGL